MIRGCWTLIPGQTQIMVAGFDGSYYFLNRICFTSANYDDHYDVLMLEKHR